MCGITAYIGRGEANPFLIQGLERLEYRGYDSSGVTVLNNGHLTTVKKQGRLATLKEEIQNYDMSGHVGIGHTRWATHGEPSDTNSHPHNNAANTLSLVHNGIIENYRELKADLIAKGYTFKSETDTEVVVHYIDYFYQGDLLDAVYKALALIEGSYALCIVSTEHPDEIIITRKDSPLIVGQAEEGSVAASDIPALLSYTKDVYFLDNYEVAVMTPDSVAFYDQNRQPITKELVHIPYDMEAAQKEGYDTFMIKEIYEQPRAITNTLSRRIVDNEIVLDEIKDVDFTKFNKVYYVACGTAYHACLCGASIMERSTKLPVFSMAASEFRYSDPLIDEQTLCFFVSQSGETADTLAALHLSQDKGCTSIAVVNALGSSLAREADYTLYQYAGPEIAVASTKAYTTQVVLLTMLAVYIAKKRNCEVDDSFVPQLASLPQLVQKLIDDEEIFANYAKYLSDKEHCYFIGRLLDYVSVLEGALKLKEISYVHADAYIGGELKHGSIALIEEGTVVVAVATQPQVAAKTISNIQETVARGANVLLFTTESQKVNGVDHIYLLPEVHPLLMCVLIAVPLQLFAYHTATLRGRDVDKPRNLAKSVTVE